MFGKAFLVALALCGTVWAAAGREGKAPEDIADVPSRELHAGDDAHDAHMRYYLIGPMRGAEAPEEGYGLVLVLPGGDGGPDCQPFVKRIFKHALPEDYLVAQLVAVKWTPEQKVVWPTGKTPVPEQEFSTEEFVEAVVKDVAHGHKLNPRHIFALAWSSGGPAAYAVSLQEEKAVTGSFIAMSVFKPSRLPSPKAAKGHAYFLYHSPDDRVCPFRLAKGAEVLLRQNEAEVELATYEGGHGWHGDLYGDIRRGIRWLEQALLLAAEEEAGAPAGPVLLRDGFEYGAMTPNGWRQGAAVPGVKYIWDRRSASAGRASLCLQKTAQSFFPIAEWSRTVSHRGSMRKLRVSAQVRARQAAKAVIDVQFLAADGEWIEHEWAAYIGAKKASDPLADHDWKEYAGTVPIPRGTRQVRLALQIYGPGTVWFDELTATYAGP